MPPPPDTPRVNALTDSALTVTWGRNVRGFHVTVTRSSGIRRATWYPAVGGRPDSSYEILSAATDGAVCYLEAGGGHRWEPRPDGALADRRLRSHMEYVRSAGDDLCEQAIGAVELRAGFRRLNRTERELLYSHYVDGVSVGELSVLLNIGDNAVHQRLRRARENLRRQVEVGIGWVIRQRWRARKGRNNA